MVLPPVPLIVNTFPSSQLSSDTIQVAASFLEVYFGVDNLIFCRFSSNSQRSCQSCFKNTVQPVEPNNNRSSLNVRDVNGHILL